MKLTEKVNHKVGFFLTKYSGLRSIIISRIFLLKQSAVALLLLFPFFSAILSCKYSVKESFGVSFGVNFGVGYRVILMPIFHVIILGTKHEIQKNTNTKEKLC